MRLNLESLRDLENEIRLVREDLIFEEMKSGKDIDKGITFNINNTTCIRNIFHFKINSITSSGKTCEITYKQRFDQWNYIETKAVEVETEHTCSVRVSKVKEFIRFDLMSDQA